MGRDTVGCQVTEWEHTKWGGEREGGEREGGPLRRLLAKPGGIFLESQFSCIQPLPRVGALATHVLVVSVARGQVEITRGTESSQEVADGDEESWVLLPGDTEQCLETVLLLKLGEDVGKVLSSC